MDMPGAKIVEPTQQPAIGPEPWRRILGNAMNGPHRDNIAACECCHGSQQVLLETMRVDHGRTEVPCAGDHPRGQGAKAQFALRLDPYLHAGGAQSGSKLPLVQQKRGELDLTTPAQLA